MVCPKCGLEMESGAIEVRGTAGGFLIFGFSYQHLWWYPGGDGRRQSRRRLLRTNERGSALRCGNCSIVLFEASDAT